MLRFVKRTHIHRHFRPKGILEGRHGQASLIKHPASRTFATGKGSTGAGTETGRKKRYVKKQQASTKKQGQPVDRPGKPSVGVLRHFEALWLKYREELHLGKQAASSVLEEVAKGRLTCDADLLRDRARLLIELDPMVPRLRLRQLLSSSPHTLLAHDPKLLLARATRFAALLPSYDTTYVLLTVMPHMDRDPVLTAANLLELDDIFARAFGGARVPPSVFAYLLRAPGATLLPPPPLPFSGLESATTAVCLPSATAFPSASQNVIKRANSNTVPTAARGLSLDEAFPASMPVQRYRGAAEPPHQDAPLPPEQQQEVRATEQQQLLLTPTTMRQQQSSMAQPTGAASVAQRRLGTLLQHRRHLNPTDLLRRLQGLVSLFGRETAYVGVQRHPALLDRDPRDMAARAAQLLAAVESRVDEAQAAALAISSSAPTLGRPLARLLEDAPEALDLDLGEVRRRLQELVVSMQWRTEHVGQLILHAPEVLLRDPVACRGNIGRLRLYALRRPTTWGVELAACLGASNPPVAVAAASASAHPAPAIGQRRSRRVKVASVAGTPASTGETIAERSSGGQHLQADAFGQVAAELDADVLSLVAKILTVNEEVVDRFEYLILTGERDAVTVRELMYESRVKFVRQCPRYTRWWTESTARQRGEGDGAFGLGSGLEEWAADDGLDEGRDERGSL